MIYFKFTILKNNRYVGGVKKFFIAFFSLFLPKSNPYFGKIINEAYFWYIEFDEQNNYTNREIGLDINMNPIVCAPYKDDLGLWTDSDLTMENYIGFNNMSYITKEDFDQKWIMINPSASKPTKAL